ncbi:MAG: hypothetical protein CME06_10640 [Gemmatimonadetes bacterium]|nr:hypothetical protein [Gemmatimonadota bacterium]
MQPALPVRILEKAVAKEVSDAVDPRVFRLELAGQERVDDPLVARFQGVGRGSDPVVGNDQRVELRFSERFEQRPPVSILCSGQIGRAQSGATVPAVRSGRPKEALLVVVDAANQHE